MVILIKKAENTEHYKIIEKLAEEIWSECYTLILDKGQIKYMLEKFQSENAIADQVKDGFIYFWSECNNVPTGYCSILPEADGLFLSKFYVKKEFRGNGIAKKLLNHALKPFMHKKPFRIHLTVNKYNKNSISIYQKMNFEIFNEITKDIGGGFLMDDFEMEKIIK